MSGVAAAMTRRGDSDYAINQGPAEAHATPSLLDTVIASVRTSRDEQPFVQRDRLQDAYEPVVDTLTRSLGGASSDYTPDWFHYDPLHPYDGDKVWEGVERARAKGIALPDLPATRDEFEHGAVNRGGGFEADEGTLARSGKLAQFAGGLVGGLSDPRNIAAGALTGGWGKGLSLARGVLVDALGNAGAEALQLSNVDDRAAHRRLYGQDLTLGDAAERIGFAAAGGAAFHLGGRAIGRAADSLPLGTVIDRFKAKVPEELRTPDENASLHTAEQAHETEATSPFTDTHAGLAAHTQNLQAMLDAVQGEPAPAPASASVRAPSPAATPDLDHAWQAITGIEGGADRNGRFRTSPKGAVGPAQLMPATAPLAAKVAGVPFDAARYRSDFAYNEMLGKAWYADLLRRFDGDTAKAAAAYNAGEGSAKKMTGVRGAIARAEQAGRPNDWASFLPAKETRDYVANFVRRTGAAGPVDVSGIPETPTLAVDEVPEISPWVSSQGRTIPTASFAPGEIGVDANLMQFKSGGDALGVTDRLHGVGEWDPLAAGMATVWEANDGRRLIADGHQRLGLANRMIAADPSQDIRLNAFVLRESEGFSAADARVLTALKNIGEGTGTAIDAAKVLRDVGLDSDAVLKRLPPRSALIRDGKALGRLSPEAFGAVINDVIPEAHGAVIGSLAHDPATHAGLVEVLHATAPETRKQAEAIVRQALDVGFTAERQEELFGARDSMASLFASKARVLDRTLAELRKMKGAFQVAARNADTLESAGNTISVDASEAAAAGNARALALVDRLALRKGNAVNALFNEAAQRLAGGEPIGSVVKSLVGDLRKLDLADVDRTVRSAGDAGDRSLDGGSGAHDASADGEQHLTPADRDELEAAGQVGFGFDDQKTSARFDDPAGDGVRVAADSAWHDIAAQSDDPNIAARQRQQTQLRAEAPLRGENRSGQAQDGTMGSPLFDAADAPTFDLNDGRGARPIAAILADLDSEKAGIDAIRGCLL